MKSTVGRFLDESIENGTISENQTVYFYDKNNNIAWVGRAGYSPLYLDRHELENYEFVGNELRINHRSTGKVTVETATLKKIERNWTIIIHREDGTCNTYRFQTKAEANRWAKQNNVKI